MTQPSRVFLYAELQLSAPFTKDLWTEINQAMHTVPGMRSKTWLSGINNHSVESARAYAEGMLADFAKTANTSLSVKLFDGDVVAEASKDMNSPFFIN